MESIQPMFIVQTAFGITGEASDGQSFWMAMNLHNKPNNLIKIYRSIPNNIKSGINPGDWVAVSRKYAGDHGRSHLNNDFKIISKTVYARDGNSISEWGYDPQPRDKAADAARFQRIQEKKQALIAAVAAMSDADRQAIMTKWLPNMIGRLKTKIIS
jgi:hydrogenase maturation factor